ncbi:SpoIIE family protein phosphatase [Streptomyces sp. NRRL S-118]|uniref:SpoIIE family protein phosphatase n=1 Tax=Streptomyces sp. NRRL S-118 TaxID=1463881 RepID=UPI000AC3B544
MGSFPTQRAERPQPAPYDITELPPAHRHHLPPHQPPPNHSVARTSLPGNPLAPAAARRFVRAALADWTGLALPAAAAITERVADDAVLVVAELVTNAVVHAGTTVELLLRLEEPDADQPAALVLEVSDHHPTRTVRSEHPAADDGGGPEEYGRGLQLVAALAECWGITYRPGLKTVWARLPLDGWDTCPVPGTEPAIQRGLRAAEILAPAPRRPVRDDQEWAGSGALTFLAEASDLLAGQLDEDLVAALAGQLLVPRLADWCAFWLEGDGGEGPVAAPRLARVWHADESAIEPLRAALHKEPPPAPDAGLGGPVPVRWPGADGDGDADGGGTALACRLVVGGRGLGTLMLGRRGTERVPDAVTALVEDFARRVALAIGAARRYTRQATISRVLQRGLLPSQMAQIPGVASCVVYEPSDDGLAGGDFYDVFQAAAPAAGTGFGTGTGVGLGALPDPRPGTDARPGAGNSGPRADARPGATDSGLRTDARPAPATAGSAVGPVTAVQGGGGRPGRWCFMLGDVQGSGPEAAVVTGLARPWLRLLAREGHRVGEVLDRLNRLLLDDATEAAEAAALVVAAAGGPDPQPPSTHLTQPRFLSLLYGELTPLPPEEGGGARCTLACAGHPLPLLLRPDGSVTPVAVPQVLLGVVDDVAYESHTFHLAPGDTLLCVTDGVTERRSRAGRMFDDEDGLAQVLAGCTGLTAQGVADRIRQAVHAFGEGPVADDLALLVLQARERPA